MKLATKFKKGMVVALAATAAVTAMGGSPVDVYAFGSQVTYYGPQFFGVQTVYLNVGDTFDPWEGVSARGRDGIDITHLAKVYQVGNVDTATPGRYKIRYWVKDTEGYEKSVDRYIIVEDKYIISEDGPTISGIDAPLVVNVGDGTKYALDGVSAIDKDGTDVTSRIEVITLTDLDIPGFHPIRYRVADKDWLTTQKSRTVIVLHEFDADRTPPKFNGVSDHTIEAGSEFNALEGVQAIDSQDGDISEYIYVSGDVDTDTPGVYTLSYRSINTNGNETVVESTVTVENSKNPVFTGLTPLTVRLNGFFSPFTGVTATAADGTNLRMQMHVSGIFDTSKPGDLVFTYTVSDADGNTTVAERIITVLPE